MDKSDIWLCDTSVVGFFVVQGKRKQHLKEQITKERVSHQTRLKSLGGRLKKGSNYSTIKKRSARLKDTFGTTKTLQVFLRELVL